ncbi:hypothetical protein [Endozoicomonas acroporae]|uniref:hypothetical protein n=1 Tax=Endozoicomonas acroporae TaxID=1701104 RepID=UPI003D7AE11A
MAAYYSIRQSVTGISQLSECGISQTSIYFQIDKHDKYRLIFDIDLNHLIVLICCGISKTLSFARHSLLEEDWLIVVLWVVASGQWAVGSWQWAVGSWQLAVGSWQLAVGSW